METTIRQYNVTILSPIRAIPLIEWLAGSAQSSPVFFVNPQNGVSYPVVAQTPEYLVDSVSALENLPVSAAGAPSQVLGGLAESTRSTTVC